LIGEFNKDITQLVDTKDKVEPLQPIVKDTRVGSNAN